jgi:hypothetical protein
LADPAIHSGSTFVHPDMSARTDTFRKLRGVEIGYEPIGSSAGITEVRGPCISYTSEKSWWMVRRNEEV